MFTLMKILVSITARMGLGIDSNSEGVKMMETEKKPDFIYEWIKKCIEGTGGLLNYEKYEWAIRNDTDEMTAACWIIRCLANPESKGSEEVLQAIIERRKELSNGEMYMKYFEVLTPYYALLKAEEKEAAKLEYNASVAGLEDINDINEVPEDYALLMFSRALGEDKKLVEPNMILEDFRNPEVSILVLDGALL